MNSLKAEHRTFRVAELVLVTGLALGMATVPTTADPFLVADHTSPIAMGYVRIGAANPAGNDVLVTLTNTGDTATDPLSCVWDSGVDFFTTGCNGEIIYANGAPLTFVITSLPGSFGVLSDVLHISYGGRPLDFIVTAVAPELWVTPGSHTFPKTTVGQSGAPKTFVIANDDSASHDLTTPFPVSGDSASFLLSPPGATDLSAGESTTFTATFSPTVTGLLSCSIVITSDATTLMPVAVEGLGVLEPEVSITGITPNDGTLVLQWEANRTDLLYTVESCTDLLAATWDSVTPTSQWWIAKSIWTNTGPARVEEFFRVKAKQE